MDRKINLRNSFTIIEMIVVIVLLGLTLIPLGMMAMEYLRGTFYSRDLAVAEGLAKTELSKVNNVAFSDPTLADGYDNTTINYEGQPYDLRRTVTLVPGTANALKQVQVRVYPTGDLGKHLVNITTFVANVSFGAGSGGGLISIPAPPCFLGETPILMADGSQKSIEEVKVGDVVISFDEKTNSFKEDKVSKLFKHKVGKYLIINQRIKVTANHLFYSKGKWVMIGRLKVGDTIFNRQGLSEEITSIEKVFAKAIVYNLEINPYHAYIACGVVAHNKKPDDIIGTE